MHSRVLESSPDLVGSHAVNAAILSPMGTTLNLGSQLAEVKKLFDINYFSLISMVALAIPHLGKPKTGGDSTTGRIIMVSSGAATKGVSGWGAYSWVILFLCATTGPDVDVPAFGEPSTNLCFQHCSASKAVLNSLARTLGSEEPSIVTVAVRPGVVDTEMQVAIRETGESSGRRKLCRGIFN